jgi:hypothetical protein
MPSRTGDDLVGHEELRVLGPAVGTLGQPHLLLAERAAVRAVAVLLVGGAVADVAAHADEGWTVGGGAELAKGSVERAEVVGVLDADDVPAVGLEPLANVLAERELRRALDGDLVVVVDPAEVRELQVPGQRGGLAGDALHHAAIARERVDVIVEELEAGAVVGLGEPALGDCHADAGRNALAKRASGGLNAGGPAVLGMAGAGAVELAEALDRVERHRGLAERLVVGVDRLDAGQVQQRIEQHRGVADREDEAVAVRPDRLLRVEAQVALPEGIGDRREPHRGARVAGVRSLHRVDRQRADGVDRDLVEIECLCHRRFFLRARCLS